MKRGTKKTTKPVRRRKPAMPVIVQERQDVHIPKPRYARQIIYDDPLTQQMPQTPEVYQYTYRPHQRGKKRVVIYKKSKKVGHDKIYVFDPRGRKWTIRDDDTQTEQSPKAKKVKKARVSKEKKPRAPRKAGPLERYLKLLKIPKSKYAKLSKDEKEWIKAEALVTDRLS